MNREQIEYIKSFLNKCKIVINNFDDLNGMLIPREIFLDSSIYSSVKEDIAMLKQIFASSSLTALQSTAECNQRWPLLNLVRQILKSCNYKMTPKRVSAGYMKDGTKIYKRMFVVDKLSQTELSATSVAATISGLGVDSTESFAVNM